MNYYRRYVGSYLKKTGSLSMAEDGAYSRLLDSYYATEKPIDPKKVNQIARATTAQERNAVSTVVTEFFYLGEDGLLHNERADEELGIAIPKLERLREVAHENGKKGGRPKGSGKKTESGSEGKPDPVVYKKPNPVPKNNPDESNRAHLKQPSAVNQEPNSDNRFLGEGDIPASPPTAVGASPPETPGASARILDECKRAQLEDPTETNGIVARWIRTGATPTLVVNALAEARRTRPAPKQLTAAYVDPILERLMTEDRRNRANAEARHAGTKAQLAEQSGWTGSPMPDNLKPRKAASA